MEQNDFTLAELLRMPKFPGQVLLTRQPEPEDVVIRHVSVIEPPAGNFVRPGELVLTTAVGCGEDNALLTFVRDLAESGAVAVMLSFEDPGRRVPEAVLDFAKERLPLVLLPWELRFADIVEAVLNRVRAAEERTGARYEALQAQMLSTYLSGRGLSSALPLLAAETGCDAMVTDRAGKVLASTAPQEIRAWKLLLPVRVQSQELGALWLSGARATPEYLDALTAWSPNILTPLLLWLDRAELRTASQAQLRDELIRSLAEGTFADTEENRARARLLGLWPDRARLCLVGLLPQDRENKAETDEMFAMLRGASAAPGTTLDGGVAFYLAPEDPVEQGAAALDAALQKALPGLHAFWGADGPGLRPGSAVS